MIKKLFPAHAGVILKDLREAIQLITFPRPRGGDPLGEQPVKKKEIFSPPTRG